MHHAPAGVKLVDPRDAVRPPRAYRRDSPVSKRRRRTMERTERTETLIIGGGQAGLSVGYHLQRRGRSFLIVDGNEHVGDSWRERWDSLKLYSPARRDGLPGMPFPASRISYPSKDEMADYLETYVERFELPVRTSTRIETL